MPESKDAREAKVVPSGDGRRSWFLGGLLTWKAAGEQTERRWELVEQRGRRGFAAPFHIHHAQTEAFYVLDGEITFHLGEREASASAGAFALVPPGTRHAFVVESDEARVLVVVSPSGLREFFEELGQATQSPGLPSPDVPMPDPSVLESTAKRFGMTILGPPPRPREPH
jgi:quercetin dioxygenase-like cupin family protein